jgi:hypothetical protein
MQALLRGSGVKLAVDINENKWHIGETLQRKIKNLHYKLT